MRVVFVLRCDHGMTFASWRTRAACVLSFARRTVARGEGCIDANANNPQAVRRQQLTSAVVVLEFIYSGSTVKHCKRQRLLDPLLLSRLARLPIEILNLILRMAPRTDEVLATSKYWTCMQAYK